MNTSNYILFGSNLRLGARLGMFLLASAWPIAFSQDEYSLGNSVNAGSANGVDLDSSTGDFVEDDSASLFGDEAGQQPAFNGEASTAPSSNAPANFAVPSNPAAMLSPPPLTTEIPTTTEAPLRTDGSIAPVAQRDPLAPNDFAGVPPMPGSRRNLARGQAPEIYDVESGDTLFDVCSQLIDDGNYWPRLWSINPDIKNPHFIYPGMKLAFYPGDAENPPYIDVVEEDDMVPVDKGPLREAELVAQQSDIPSILPKTNANVAGSGESVEIVGPEGISIDSSITEIFDIVGSVIDDPRTSLTLPAFIFPTEKQSVGFVAGGTRGERLAGDGILIKIARAPTLALGRTYTVLRPSGEVKHPETEEVVGYRYEFAGNLQVSDRLEEELFVGRVQDTSAGVRFGDLVVDFLSTKRTVDTTVSGGFSAPVEGMVVSMGIPDQTFGGQGALVYINKGGLASGTTYPIFQKTLDSSLNGASSSSDDAVRRSVGTVKVIESSDKISVAIVTQNSTEIRIGDKLSSR